MNSTSGLRARRMTAIVACLLGITAALVPGTSAAQTAAGTRPYGWLVGGSIGIPTVFGGELEPELLTLGAQFTHVRVNRPGVDFALGTVPRTLGFGVLSLGMRGGVALPLLLAPSVMLLPSAGVSVLGGFGSGGAGGSAGYNFGLSAVFIPPKDKVAVRAGATRHTFGTYGNFWLLEIGLSRAPGRR